MNLLFYSLLDFDMTGPWVETSLYMNDALYIVAGKVYPLSTITIFGGCHIC